MIMSLLITLLILILVVFLVFKIVHVILKTIIIVGVLLFLIFGLLSFLAYTDGVSFKMSFINGTNTFLLVSPDSSSLITGFALHKGSPVFFTQSTFSNIKLKYADKNLKGINDFFNSSRLLIFKQGSFNSSISFDKYTLPYSEVNAVLLSPTPIKDLAHYLADNNDENYTLFYYSLSNTFDNSSLKSALFAEQVNSEASNPLFLFNSYKSGSLKVFPNTILFKTVNFVPLSMIKNFASKFINSSEER